MLIADAWGQYGKDNDEGDRRYYTEETIGQTGLPGERFGGGDGVSDSGFLYGNWRTTGSPELDNPTQMPDSYIPYYRHPSRSSGFQELQGGANMAFADGSVRNKRATELFEPNSGRSTFEVLWSRLDRDLDRD